MVRLQTVAARGALLLVMVATILAVSPVAADGFRPTRNVWQDFFCLRDEVCLVGDFNGDGRDDIITFVRSTTSGPQRGDVYVALSNGSTFGASSQWKEFFCLGQEQCAVGDVNGDGRDDIITFVGSTASGPQAGDVFVALSNGSSFGASQQWKESFCLNGVQCVVADVDGDGKADALEFIRSTVAGSGEGDVFVALSTGGAFGITLKWHDFFCIGDETCTIGDFNGDGRADIITFVRSTQSGDNQGDVYVALSDGTRFAASSVWHPQFCIGADVCAVGDFNGDNRDDAASFVRNTKSGAAEGNVLVTLSSGGAFNLTVQRWIDYFCVGNETCATGDFNGDGRDDIITFVRDTLAGDLQGNVYVALADPTLTSPIVRPVDVYLPLILQD